MSDSIEVNFVPINELGELPVCPRCNHRHRLLKRDGKWVPMDKCPYCNCPLHFDLLEGEYVL